MRESRSTQRGWSRSWLAASVVSAALWSGCALEDEESVDVEEGALTSSIWLYENADALTVGPLAGQNGWSTFSGDSSPTVFPVAGHGNAIKTTPPDGSGLRESAHKDFVDQTWGTHTIQFTVKPNANITEVSSAKIVFNGAPDGSTKVVQIYVGDGMRINNGAGTAPLYGQGEIALGSWYQVSCIVSFGAARSVTCNAGPEDQPPVKTATLPLPANVTAISTVDIFAWDVPGAVLFDDILGARL